MSASSYILSLFLSLVTVLVLTWASCKLEKEAKHSKGTEKNFLRVVSDALGVSSTVLLVLVLLVTVLAMITWVAGSSQGTGLYMERRKKHHDHGHQHKHSRTHKMGEEHTTLP